MRRAFIILAASLAFTGCSALDFLFPPANPSEGDGSGSTGDTGRPVFPISGTITVQLISRSDVPADLTVQFRVGSSSPDPTQIRLAAYAQTEVIGPDAATDIEVSGTYDGGAPVPLTLFGAKVDFAPGRPAVYYLSSPNASGNVPPTIAVVQPAADVSLVDGGSLRIAWTYVDPDSTSLVVAYLDGNGIDLDGDEIRLTPAISGEPTSSGSDDLLVGIPSNTPPGTYHVLLAISDASASATARSSTTVTVLESRPDQPKLTLLAPDSDVTVALGNSAQVRWTDHDDEHSASIRFFLVPSGDVFPGIRAVALGGVFPEDPDGPGDQTNVIASGIATGTYDLWAMMDNGSQVVTSKAPGKVTVAPPGATGSGGATACPNPPAIVSVDPPSGARGSTIEVTIRGAYLASGGPAVRLSQSGQPDIVASQVQVAADGASLTCGLDLHNAAVGAWDVVVSVPDCAEAALIQGFVVSPSAQFDDDGDVDMDEFRLFFACFNGPNNPLPATVANCDWADLDTDGDVDEADFLIFQSCFNGPNRPSACQ
jgi:hypothetical protein